MSESEHAHDADIASLSMSEIEKNGLQVFRNYQRAFQKHASRMFVDEIDKEELDKQALARVVSLLVSEEPRALPVIACAFADEVLEAAFRHALPDGIPGGRSSMFSGYGPLSDLSKRIKLAYAFDLCSAELMQNLDQLRAVRNKISHSWDTSGLAEFYNQQSFRDMAPISALKDRLTEIFEEGISPLAAFRINVIWLMCRLVYEGAAYDRAKKAKLDPLQVLFLIDPPVSKWLRETSGIALQATYAVVKSQPTD